EKTTGGNKSPVFSVCCGNGKVVLPSMTPLPDLLMQLLTGSTPDFKNFCKNIRAYNAAFVFTSLGTHIDESIVGLLPSTSSTSPHFAQLYVYDTEHEIQNRLDVMPCLEPTIVKELTQMLNNVNPYVAVF
ncbi:5548_t:CDS:2, partial [Cetraspora pellucida]